MMADIKYFELKGNIIQDSMLLLRSIIFNKEKKYNDVVHLLEELVPKHPIPNTSVYLTVNIDLRKKRVLKRIESNPNQVTKNDILILNNPEQFEKRNVGLMELSQKYFNSIVLDTSEMTETETANYIISLCKRETVGI